MYKWCGRRLGKSTLICISISALNNKLKIRDTTPPPPPPHTHTHTHTHRHTHIQLTPEGHKEHLGEEW